MADTNVKVQAIGKSEAEVAYQLFLDITRVEKKNLYAGGDSAGTAADRDYILKTFSQCMAAVKNPFNYL